MTAVLGDFLGPAAEHIARAASCRDDLPGAESGRVALELGRVIAALGQFLGDIALPDEAGPQAPGNASARTTARTRQALRRSALTLRQAAEIQGQASSPGTHPAAIHLAAAASHLAAAHDLLLDRWTPGPPAHRTSAAALVGRFYWAAVAVSPPVTDALLAEITGHARTLAPWAAQLSQGLPADTARAALHDAARWLYSAAGTADAWQQHQALPREARARLHGIPVPLIPARCPPAGPETVAELCAGITGTATRLRHAAVAFVPGAMSSPAANSVSWRRHARAIAITTHASHLVLYALADRAGQLSSRTALAEQVRQAARLAAEAWPRQRATSHVWDRFTTGHESDAELTPVAAEIDDLVLRIGRLAFHNPGWTPDTAQSAARRKPERLAPATHDISTVITAIHHAADATLVIAAADRQAIRQAAQAGRIYIPTWLLADYPDAPHRYSPSPAPRTRDLLTTYRNAAKSATKLTAALDEIAVSTGLSSGLLAAPRRNPVPQSVGGWPGAAGGDPETDPATAPEAGQLRKMLHDLRISEPTMLTRAELADAVALDLIAEAADTARRRHDISGLAMQRPNASPSRRRIH